MADRVNWRTISREEFEAIVNVLITRHGEALGYASSAPSGRGGDDGIDIEFRDVSSGRLVHVYQLKHFPEGFSGGWGKSRKSQIRKSFARAGMLDMHDWTLVVPEEFTKAEQVWVTALAAGTSVRIHIMGTVELDRMLARYPDVQGWSVRSAVNEALDRVGRKDLAPRTSSEASEGLHRYLADADSFSLYWGRRLAAIDGELGWEIYAKRDDAVVMEPLQITVNAAFGKDDESVLKLATDVFGYGRRQRVELPDHVVQSIVFDGPCPGSPWCGEMTWTRSAATTA
jgi:hypothetical protein